MMKEINRYILAVTSACRTVMVVLVWVVLSCGGYFITSQRAVKADSTASQTSTRTFLYASNLQTNNISIFQVNEDGSLTLLGSPVPSGGRSNDRIVVTDDSRFLYVSLLGGGVSAFRINENGTLMALADSPIGSDPINALVISKNQQLLFGLSPFIRSLSGPGIVGYSVAADGLPRGIGSAVRALPGFSLSLAVSPDDRQLGHAGIGPNNTAVLQRFAISDMGRLDPPEDSVDMGEAGPNLGLTTCLAASPAGFFYLPNRDANTISVFDAAGRQMGLPVPNLSGAEGPNGVTVSRDGRFLFVTNQASSNVSVFRIEEDGRLTLGPGPFATGGNNATLFAAGQPTVSRDGQRLYVSNPTSADVSVFRIGADGQLMLVSGSPFSTGGGPDAFPLGLGEAVIP